LIDVFADHARHGRTQARQVGTPVALRNVVGEAQNGFVIAIVPLHGHFHTNFGAGNAAIGVGRTRPCRVEGVGVQHLFVGVDEIHKALDTTGTREIVFFAGALIVQTNANTVVEKRELAQALGQNFVVKIVVLREDLGIGQEMDFGSALVRRPGGFHGGDFKAVNGFEQAALHHTLSKLQGVHLALTANR